MTTKPEEAENPGKSRKGIMKIFNITPLKKIIAGVVFTIGAFFSIMQFINWVHDKAMDDISGKWKITFVYEKTSYSQFKGMQLVYDVFVNQNGSEIKGDGEKSIENNTRVISKFRTPISFTGAYNGKTLQLNIKEKGTERETTGMIVVKKTDSKKIYEGTFTTTAANSSGKCIIELVN